MSFVVSASQWLFLAALLKRKPSGNASEEKSLKWHEEFKITGEVCWLNGVEFRVIDFEMTPKKTAFAFAESAEWWGVFSYGIIFALFLLQVFRWFYKKKKF